MIVKTISEFFFVLLLLKFTLKAFFKIILKVYIYTMNIHVYYKYSVSSISSIPVLLFTAVTETLRQSLYNISVTTVEVKLEIDKK